MSHVGRISLPCCPPNMTICTFCQREILPFTLPKFPIHMSEQRSFWFKGSIFPVAHGMEIWLHDPRDSRILPLTLIIPSSRLLPVLFKKQCISVPVWCDQYSMAKEDKKAVAICWKQNWEKVLSTAATLRKHAVWRGRCSIPRNPEKPDWIYCRTVELKKS